MDEFLRYASSRLVPREFAAPWWGVPPHHSSGRLLIARRVCRIQSGTSSSLNLSSSSSGQGTQQPTIRGGPGMIQDGMADNSQSSSIRSVRRSQLKPSKDRPSSALARSASRGRAGETDGDDGMDFQEQGASSVNYQQVNK